ncbi:MAG: restriction endonuclease subunit S [Leptospirillum sp.]
MDGNHGEIHPKQEDYVSYGIPFIMASDLKSGGVDTKNCSFITEKQACSLRKGFAQEGDVLISHKATMGRTAIVKKVPFPFIMLTPQVTYYRVKNTNKLSNGYLKYYFDSPGFQKIFNVWGQKGSTRSYLGITAQLDLPIVIPPLPEQRAIAHILGTLDDKIELNRRINETLEAMAQAIFKSWFVDFDPVRAKMEGRETGLPKEIEDLFPDSFEDSELGEIPRGWRGGTLGDLIGQRIERISPNPETCNFPYVPIECITSKSIFLSQLLPGSEANSSLTKFYKGDIIFGAMRPYFHKVCLAAFDGITRTTAFILFPKEKEDQSFSLYSLFQEETIEFATNHSEGSTIPYAKWTGSLKSKEIVVPPKTLRSMFQKTVSSFIEKGMSQIKETISLSQIKEVLLPKLLSGEIRVHNS